MPENQTTELQQQLDRADDDVNLLDLLIVLAKHKKMILGVTFLSAVLAAGISLLTPNIYTATTKILPPQSSQSSSVNAIMLAQLGGLANAAGNALGLKDPNALYIAMLKSRNIMGNIVQRFDLQKVFEKKTVAETLKALEGVTAISGGKDGLITVEVDDIDPERAAAIANAYIEELNKLMQTYAITEASHRRQFFETQLKSAKDKLTDAEAILDKTPNTSLHYMDALRNLKYQESIYEVLAKQFAVAKLDEAKDAPLIQVLDRAVAPEKKSKPKRSRIVLAIALIAGLFGIIWAFFTEYREKAKANPGYAARMNDFKRYMWGK